MTITEVRTADAARGWTLGRGARLEEEGVRFTVWAPAARSVAVRLETVSGEREHALERDEQGVWSGLVREARAGTDYRYMLDGEKALPDPVSRHQPEGVHGPSRVVDPFAFEWTDDGWGGLALSEYAIYELHVGTFSEEGTFDGAIRHLPELVDLGITAIEVMPIAQFPGTRNWGYDGVALYAVQDSYGGPDGFRRLVDAAHAHGLAVVLDVVYNHVGPEGNYLGAYAPYFTDRYRTPWGEAVNYDGADSDEVRRFVVDNALHWITEYHVDALRLDAIHGIYDFGATHVLRELAESVRAEGRRLGREVRVIGESDLNDPRVIRSGAGGWALDAQWSDDFHHAAHALLTGERSGYYEDFGSIADLEKALRDRFVYDGRRSAHRRRRHGAPARDIPAERFVVCIQNHDQVGNRAKGERLASLVSFEQRKLGAALLLLAPYVPMLFMGEEWGETNPFLYFADHGDESLVEAVRAGRREEFKAFGWGDDVPDPFAVETFERSKLDRSKLERPEHAAIRALYRELLQLRRREPALRPGGSVYRVSAEPFERGAGPIASGILFTEHEPPAGGAWLGVFNLSTTESAEVEVRGGEGRAVRMVLSTDDRRFGGAGAVAKQWATRGDGSRSPAERQPRGLLALPPSTALLCRVEDR
ncbi:MAG TPA: malto-oligosyltrehalose trehalohydrolase [Gemmatimonadaceae bacterium]